MTGILIPFAASAQVTTSGMNGHVTDESGEPLPGAAVVAVHAPSGTQYSAVTNTEGRYVIGGMRPGGPYSVRILYIGMDPVEVSDVALMLGEAYELDAVMTASNELDAVVLVAEKTFSSGKTGAGTGFSRRKVEMSPSIDRSIYDVVKYTLFPALCKQNRDEIA